MRLGLMTAAAVGVFSLGLVGEAMPVLADLPRVNHGASGVRVHRLIAPAPDAKTKPVSPDAPTVYVTRKVTRVIVVPHGVNRYVNTTVYRRRHPGLKRPWSAQNFNKRSRWAQRTRLWQSKIYRSGY